MPYYDGDSAVELNSYLSDYLEPDGELIMLILILQAICLEQILTTVI